MTETFEDQLSRLKAMCVPGQQTWDLSPKDVAAIAMAVKAVERVQLTEQLAQAFVDGQTSGTSASGG